METLTDIAFVVSLKLLVLGNVVAVLIGLLALCAPRLLKRLTTAGNLWFSSRKMGRHMDTHINTDHIVLKHPRVSGVLLILASVLVLVKGGGYFITTPPAAGAQLITDLIPIQRSVQSFWEVVWLSLGTFILLGAFAGTVLGVLALSRDDLLARLNTAASRETSTRKWSKTAETVRSSFDKKLLEYPRFLGAVVIAFALYVLVILLPLVAPFM
jgi:hypothetical protein